MEIWKDIAGFEGMYQVSNLGRVRSLDRICGRMPRGAERNIKGMLLTPVDNGKGYMAIHLKKNGKRYMRYIHRLVAESFLVKGEGCRVVNHIDFDKKNNNASNLEWCTQKENVMHSRHHMSKQHKCQNNSGERYITIRKKAENGCVYRVNLKKAGVYKGFETLEEAIAFRNEVCNEIGYTI